MSSQLQHKWSPVAVSLENILTSKQLMTLDIAEDHGWELYFIRQDGQETAVPGIRNPANKMIGVIDVDGNFSANPVSGSRIKPEVSEILC